MSFAVRAVSFVMRVVSFVAPAEISLLHGEESAMCGDKSFPRSVESLASRKTLLEQRIELENQIRGSLKVFELKVGQDAIAI